MSNFIKNVFQTLQSTASDFVLPGLDLDKPLDENALPRAIRRIQERVGIPEWTAHDLRRTFATQLRETLNVDPVVVEKCLGHKMPRIMATYNKNEMLPQRKDALERWSSCIENLVTKNLADSVCQIAELNSDRSEVQIENNKNKQVRYEY